MKGKAKQSTAIAGVDNAEGLATLLQPTVDDLVRSSHSVIDHARESAAGVAKVAGAEFRKSAEDLQRRGERLAAKAGSELDAVAAGIDSRLARQQEALEEAGQELLDQAHGKADSLVTHIMDRGLASVLAAALFYGAYVLAPIRAERGAGYANAFVLFWAGTLVVAICLAVAWIAAGRSERLRNILVWELYILALSGICGAVLVGMRVLVPLLG